jgi:predicted AlkP superfamily phosphohydrolase/phosphomutase
MVGLDAAEWWVVERFVEEGVMPNLAGILERSTFAPITGGEAYKAEGRWAEVLTGRTADENQYWSIIGFDPTDYRCWYERSCHGSYFFARPDLNSIVFDVPNSVISEETHGIQITGWGAHAAQFPSASQPAHVLADIDRRFGVHRALLSDGHPGWHNERYLSELQRAMEDGLRQRVEICSWLDRQQPDWDLFFVVMGESHVSEHIDWHGIDERHPFADGPLAGPARERLTRTFRAIDEALGGIVDAVGHDAALVVFAAHGMQPNTSDVLAEVLVPEFLHRRTFGEPLIDLGPWHPDDGWVELDERVLPRHYLEARLRTPTPVTGAGPGALAKRAVRRIRHHLPETKLNAFERRYWRRPDWWEMHLREPAPYERRDLLTEAGRRELESVAGASWYRHLWSQMPAFVVPSFSDCHLRVNLRGRERDGLVDLDEYEAELDRLEADLRALTDARTGEPIVAEAYRPRAKDPLASIGPVADLIVSFSAVTDVVRHPEVGTVGPSPLLRIGEHTPDGWAAISRPDLAPGRLGAIEPRDLTATVVDLLGLAPSPTVTGTSALAHRAARDA